MNNNFMVTGNNPMGQKTAYGFVGGINGQSLNTMTVGSSIASVNKKRGVGSKGNLHSNVQNGIIHL